jgi:hypothetical protein
VTEKVETVVVGGVMMEEDEAVEELIEEGAWSTR